MWAWYTVSPGGGGGTVPEFLPLSLIIALSAGETLILAPALQLHILQLKVE